MENYHYGTFVSEAKKENIEIEPREVYNALTGFKMYGRISYKGKTESIKITGGHEIRLISFNENSESADDFFKGFAKLYKQKPDVVYLDKSAGYITAEFWLGYTPEQKMRNLEELLNEPSYEIKQRNENKKQKGVKK